MLLGKWARLTDYHKVVWACGQNCYADRDKHSKRCSFEILNRLRAPTDLYGSLSLLPVRCYHVNPNSYSTIRLSALLMRLWNYNTFKRLVCNVDVQVLYLVVKLDYKIAAQLQCVII